MTVSELAQTVRQLHLKLDETARFVEAHNVHWQADESTWSVAQILAHIAEFEHFFTQDVLNLRDHPGAKFGRTMEHEQRLEAVQLTGAETLDELLLAVEQSKQQTLAMLASLSDAQLQIEGTNPKFGTRTIEWEIEHFITEHVAKHIGQIERTYAMARHRSVFVIGAGPVGLTAALALSKQGISATVLEAEREGRPRPGSRAIYFHKATLQILEEIHPGVGYAFAAAGIVWPLKRTLWRGKEVYQRRYGSPQPGTIPPFASLPQDTAERILYEACVRAGVEFIWNSAIEDVKTDEAGVTLTTKSGQVWTGDYVVAADGARSTVRRAVGIEMEGTRSANNFIVVDVKEDPENPLPLERVFHYHHPAVDGRNVLFVPFAGGWRVDLQLFEGDDPDYYSGSEGVRKWLPRVMDEKYADRVTWVSTYQFLQVVAKNFTDAHRRVFLVGEAAHLFAPFGARGLNSGVPDAFSAAKAISAAIHAEDRETAGQVMMAAAEERRRAAQYNRDAAGIALEHLQGQSLGMSVKRRVAASLASIWPQFGRWLDEGPYGPRSGPSEATKY